MLKVKTPTTTTISESSNGSSSSSSSSAVVVPSQPQKEKKSLAEQLIHSLEVDGRPIVKLRLKDGYGSLTFMCKAGGKQTNHYMENKKTKAFIEKLSSVIRMTDLIEKNNGGKDQETWVHPLILINASHWLGFEDLVRDCLEKNGVKLIKFNPKFTLKEAQKPKGSEHRISNKLQLMYGGKREVKCKSGYIDLLTPTYLIEVKDARGWKGAIGQVLVYGLHYPSRKLKLVLFNVKNITPKKHIENVCENFNINVEWYK
jgi:hypothetical protein